MGCGHISVLLRTSIDNAIRFHLLPNICSPLFINPRWLIPMFGWYDPKLHRGRRQDSHASHNRATTQNHALVRLIWLKNIPLELLVERFLVQENIWIFIFAIEPIFGASNTLDNPVEVGISTENNEGGIRSWGCGGPVHGSVWRDIGRLRVIITRICVKFQRCWKAVAVNAGCDDEHRLKRTRH